MHWLLCLMIFIGPMDVVQRLHGQSVSQVEQNLLKANNNFNLGVYDSSALYAQTIIDYVNSSNIGKLETAKIEMAYYILAKSYNKIGKFSISDSIWQQYLRSYEQEKPNDIEGTIVIRCHKAMNHYYSRGNEAMRNQLDTITLLERETEIKSNATKAIIATVQAQYLGLLNKKSESLMMLDSALILFRMSADTNSEVMIRCVMTKADYLGDLGRINEARNWQIYGQRKEEILFGKNSFPYGRSYNNVGLYHWQLGDYQKASDCINKYIQTIKQYKGEGHVMLAAAYINLGNLAGTMGKTNLSLTYFHAAERLWAEDGPEHSDRIYAYANLASKYNYIENYNRSMYYLDRIEAMSEEKHSQNHFIFDAVKTLRAQAFAGARKYEKAVELCNEIDEIYAQSHYSNTQRSVENLLVLLKNQIALNHLSAAKTTASQIENMLANLDVSNTVYQSILFDHKASIELKENDFLKARRMSDEGLTALNFDVSQPEYDQIVNYNTLLSRISYRLDVEYALYLSEREQMLPDFQHIISITFESLQKTFDHVVDENDKSLLRQKFRLTAEKLLLCLYSLPAHKKNGEHFEEVLRIMELNKNTSLLADLKYNPDELRNIVDVSLVEKSNEIQRKLSYLRSNVSTLNLYKRTNLDQIETLNDSLFLMEQHLESVMEKLEQKYPQYYKSKYTHHFATIRDIQEKLLKAEDVLLQYFFGDSSFFQLKITEDSTWLHYQKLDKEFYKMTYSWLGKLQNRSARSNEIRKEGCQLYKILLSQLPQPHDKSTLRNLFVVNDGIGNYLPFELLEQSCSRGEGAYLLYDYSISYHVSASLAMAQLKQTTRPPSYFSGFAAAYDFDTAPESDATVMRSGGEILFQLPAAIEEVTALSNLVGGEVYLRDSATESNFKNIAGQLDIIHLSLHGRLSDYFPMESGLLFDTSDSLNDGVLTTAEIYGLALDAELAVLSACETGIGELKKGEGLQSISRAFTYAGAKSTLYSLWKVPDQPTKEIMVEFYRGLKKGLRKDMALQQAKMTYLKNTIEPQERHPYYWAGFVIQGNMDPIYFKSNTSFMYFLIAGVLLILLTAVYFLSRKRSK